MTKETDNQQTTRPAVATIGTFDGVHRGHLLLLARVKEEAEHKGFQSLVITFDNHPGSAINHHPTPLLTTTDEKVRLLKHAGIDSVVLLHFDTTLSRLTSKEFMEMIYARYCVRTLIVGYDHKFGSDRQSGFDDYWRHGMEIGIEVIKAPELKGAGSSAIRKMLKEGDTEEAATLLGRHYSLSGIVTEGLQNGRKIGFPTANISLCDSNQLVPAAGVYAVIATLPDGTRRGGMLNIGTRPTIGTGLHTTIEVNIFDFNGNLYGQHLKIEFIKRTRSEKRMESLVQLSKLLSTDRQEITEILNHYKI